MSRRAWVELLALAILWGSVYLLIEITLRELSPILVVFGRVSLAALLLTPLAIRRNALRLLWQRPRAIIETVLVQSTIPLLLLTFGQQYVSSGLAGILVGAQPLFVALLALRFAPDERPQGWKGVVGIIVGFAGLVLLFRLDFTGGWHALLGGLLVLMAAVGYGAGAIMIHRRHADAQPLGVATSAMIVSAVALVLPSLFALPKHIPSLATIGALAVLGIVCTGMTLVLFYTLIVQTGPARAALAFYLSPWFAVVFGVIFLSEELPVVTALGLLAIVVGSALAAQRAESMPT
jgi:drug/metabolite transporter (DMT)-like permease